MHLITQLLVPCCACMSQLTGYWQYMVRPATRVDLGHTCRQCKLPFCKIDQPLAIRRGGRIELKYHGQCFSGQADPRTQSNSSFGTGKWAGTQQLHAPKHVYNKMRTASHF